MVDEWVVQATDGKFMGQYVSRFVMRDGAAFTESWSPSVHEAVTFRSRAVAEHVAGLVAPAKALHAAEADIEWHSYDMKPQCEDNFAEAVGRVLAGADVAFCGNRLVIKRRSLTGGTTLFDCTINRCARLPHVGK